MRHSTIVAYLALFVALGGTAYAGLNLPRHSVGAKHIKPNAVKSGKVSNGSLKAKDFAAGEALGPVSVQLASRESDLPDGAEDSIDVFCPDGQVALGGGFRGDDTLSEETNVASSRPVVSTDDLAPPEDDGTFTGWRVSVRNVSGGATGGIRPEVWVVCAESGA